MGQGSLGCRSQMERVPGVTLNDCLNKPVLCTDGRVRKLIGFDAELLKVQYPMDGETWSQSYPIARGGFYEEAIMKGTIIE